MGLKKTLARGAVALSVSALPFAFGTSPAGAFESFNQTAFFEHSFTDGAGQPVTCPVSLSSSLTRESTSEPFLGTGYTSTNSDDPACDSFVAVSASYVDPNGRRKNAFADSFLGDVFLGVDDVGSEFVANHTVSFLNCSNNCDVSLQTSPK